VQANILQAQTKTLIVHRVSLIFCLGQRFTLGNIMKTPWLVERSQSHIIRMGKHACF